jgi:hypothetical protein
VWERIGGDNINNFRIYLQYALRTLFLQKEPFQD